MWVGDIIGYCLSYRYYLRVVKRIDGWEYDRENVGIFFDLWVREEIVIIFAFYWRNIYIVLEVSGRVLVVFIKGFWNED